MDEHHPFELPRPEPKPKRAWLWVLLPLAIMGAMALGPILDWRAATEGESEDVTGVVAIRRDGALYFVVSGHAERSTDQTNNGRRYTSTSVFPRLTTLRASDGGQVARRQYSPVVMRFDYVDTVVRALAAADGRVWAVSTEPGVALHAVDPLTLVDVIDARALAARAPLLAPGIYMQVGSSESPVAQHGSELVFRLDSGAWVALDPATVAVRELPGDGDEFEDAPGAGEIRGDIRVEALAEARRGVLEPDVAPVFDAEGNPDPAASYVVDQTSLDRERASIRITRWDTSGAEPVVGWSTTLAEVHPDCCQLRAWRDGGQVFVWYEHWLVALDDATGERRWLRRL